MSRLRPNRSTLLITLGFLTLAGLLGYQQYRITQLQGSLATTADKSSLDALLTRVSGIDDRLDDAGIVEGQPLVTNDDFMAGQRALSNRLDAVQASTKQIGDQSTRDLLMLKADVELLNTTVQELKKTPPPAPVAAKKAPPVRAAPQSKPKAKPSPALEAPPPFHIIGVEYRGGERFLSVAPPGSTRLSQIYLIRAGDIVAGTSWHLRSLDDHTARFDVAGNARTISLQP